MIFLKSQKKKKNIKIYPTHFFRYSFLPKMKQMPLLSVHFPAISFRRKWTRVSIHAPLVPHTPHFSSEIYILPYPASAQRLAAVLDLLFFSRRPSFCQRFDTELHGKPQWAIIEIGLKKKPTSECSRRPIGEPSQKYLYFRRYYI